MRYHPRTSPPVVHYQIKPELGDFGTGPFYCLYVKRWWGWSLLATCKTHAEAEQVLADLLRPPPKELWQYDARGKMIPVTQET